MIPSALVFLDGRKISEEGGLGREGEGYSQSPINVRANKWLVEYDVLLAASMVDITSESQGSGLKQFMKRDASDSYDGTILRGTVLFILRNPSRDLRLIETFLNIETQNNPSPALQALINRSKFDKDRRTANYHTFRGEVFALANAFLKPFEAMYHCLPRDAEKTEREIFLEGPLLLCGILLSNRL